MSSTIGVDFRVKTVTLGGKTAKLTIWDTAGQERFRTLTSSYYRGCHGVILVFDVNERESFTHLQQWLEELDLYSTTQHSVKLLVGNKIDVQQREVSVEEAETFARRQAMMYIETSAKTREGIRQAFEEVVQKILDTPSLLQVRCHHPQHCIAIPSPCRLPNECLLRAVCFPWLRATPLMFVITRRRRVEEVTLAGRELASRA